MDLQPAQASSLLDPTRNRNSIKNGRERGDLENTRRLYFTNYQNGNISDLADGDINIRVEQSHFDQRLNLPAKIAKGTPGG